MESGVRSQGAGVRREALGVRGREQEFRRRGRRRSRGSGFGARRASAARRTEGRDQGNEQQ
jgi:hypothetical protein